MQIDVESSKAARVINPEPTPIQWSAYYPPIPRRFVEGLCNVSSNTILKYENEGILHPHKVKHGAMDYVVYTADDVQRFFKKRGYSLNRKGEAEVIAVWSQKGGVGKSAFTQHIAGLLSLTGRTLIIDLDSQADVTALVGGGVKAVDLVDADAEQEPTILELMDWTLKDTDEYPYQRMDQSKVIKKISPNLHLIQSDLDLAEINYSLNRLPLVERMDASGRTVPGILMMIKEVVEKVKGDYDYILFDCPPNIESCNVSALFAANRILIPLELEAKCLKTMKRNEDFLNRLATLHPGFKWDKILVVANKFRRENIKIKALAKLQDIYQERTDIQLSAAIFANSAIVDKCSEMKEPMNSFATRFGKEFKSSLPQAKEFTDLFWVVIHEILDAELTHMIFADQQTTFDN